MFGRAGHDSAVLQRLGPWQPRYGIGRPRRRPRRATGVLRRSTDLPGRRQVDPPEGTCEADNIGCRQRTPAHAIVRCS